MYTGMGAVWENLTCRLPILNPIPEWSPNHSTGDVDQMLGLANDYLSSDDRVGLEGR